MLNRNQPSRIFLLSLYSFLFCFAFPVKAYDKHTLPDSAFLARKEIRAIRISVPPKIDGILNEPFWKDCPVAFNFVVYSPGNGSVPAYPTEVRFAFDDQALYISAILFDNHPDSICREMGRRDQVESLNTDYISFDILPYNDQLNMYEFKVTPANLQNDCKYSATGTDITWDAVWESGAKINDSSWVTEVKIPYSALRFPKVDKQVWGINMWRNFHRKQEYSTWTFVDNKARDIFKYYGSLVGIDNIHPPIRLSFSPYISGYLNKDPGKKDWSYFLRGGLDVRYGINESYTLDMMLIPDFGQVQSDDQVLNLTPFEVRYDEKRQFFTEATELFNKCGIFYSRRVGSTPADYYLPYDSARVNEKVTDNPEETRIINATKISGRNSKGLGVGFFNAMTTNTWAKLEDTLTGVTRKIMTQPYTNYNVLVFDQNLKNNSYVTLINTNYYIPGNKQADNVTGCETRICNKNNTLALFGRLNVSQLYKDGSSPDFGHRLVLSISKPSGKFQYEVARDQMDNHYDPNAMGFLTNNNEVANYGRVSYNIFDPVWKILQSETDFLVYYNTLYYPNKMIIFRTELASGTMFKNFWQVSFMGGSNNLGYNDYYEPRVWGWVYKKPFSFDLQFKIATDPRKTFRLQGTSGIMNSSSNNNFDYWCEIVPRVRFSDRFTVSLYVSYYKNMNEYGWVNTIYQEPDDPVIYFGRRDVTTVSNVVTAQFVFNTKASVSLRVRHYWSRAEYFDYLDLNKDGSLDKSNYWGDHNINYNAFTADLQFVWYFAPGSEMSVVWKNLINTQDDKITYNYWEDFRTTVSSPQSNSFSIKILYYLDYLYIKKAFSKKGPGVK